MITDRFADRHIGPRDSEIREMLDIIGARDFDDLIDQTIPKSIRLEKPLHIGTGLSEYEYQQYIREIGNKNKRFKTYIGTGYYGTVSLPVIRRNILENPAWYTSYTPYQAEISQGRLEALLNFQTVITDLTGMELANASLLDESTAAAEAMTMMFNLRSREGVRNGVNKFFVDSHLFPQTMAVLETRSLPLGIEIVTGDFRTFVTDRGFFGCLVQYPNSDGEIFDYSNMAENAHKGETLVGVIADIMSLVMLTPPGEWGADIVAGSTQRFGVPLGFGGPHAAYFATREQFKRNIPGRIIGISVDRHGNPALRMALQTREQHIKRERATSNICTAEALLATMASMYAVYHGAEGLRKIASGIHFSAVTLAGRIEKLGFRQLNANYFDTLRFSMAEGVDLDDIRRIAIENEINLRYNDDNTVNISMDETVTVPDLNRLTEIFARSVRKKYDPVHSLHSVYGFNEKFQRHSDFLSEKVFRKYRSETDLMRYIKMLERKDFSLTQSMISLGSCTMKLNAASELFAFLWPEFADIHPFVPIDQVEGYHQLFSELARDLREITGFEEISFQPNSGAAGEYTGLMVIRAYHESRGQSQRNVVLIPASAHGTNPASAVMAGMEVVVVRCDDRGNIDVDDLRNHAVQYRDRLAAFMITYPSTHGVFEEQIREMVDLVHENGGQVYMDGANMNAQVGLTSPGYIGADVCHLNLHKTFAIPHGGGGPGVGPVGVAKHLVEFLPSHPVVSTGGVKGIPAVAGAPYGSASILTISHAYIKMLGTEGLVKATKVAILNANYLSVMLRDHFRTLYTGEHGRVGHEMILECRNFKQEAGISEADIAKRLMDYGFHAPTLSFPVHGTLMVEPTESESPDELNRFIDAMKSIHAEIMEVKDGKADREDNVLKNAPHTAVECISDSWKHSYGREKAAFPRPWIMMNKFFPAVGRVDDAYGDRNLVCTCAPVEDYRVAL